MWQWIQKRGNGVVIEGTMVVAVVNQVWIWGRWRGHGCGGGGAVNGDNTVAWRNDNFYNGGTGYIAVLVV